MKFFEDISRFYGTGEKNKDGQTLEEFLEVYDAKKFDCPSNTTDIVVVRSTENLKEWGQPLEVLLVRRGNHPGIGFWATPGGFVDMKENLFEGAARELEEETGVKGLPLVQLRTWGDYDRDPRWRVITTSFLALVEGDVPVKAGDDAEDAVWFEVQMENKMDHQMENTEIWNLHLKNKQYGFCAGASVAVTHSGHKILQQENYKLIESIGLAGDHGCLIVQALLYMKEKLG